MSVERRRAAILSADAKGFSRLMSEDELGTVRTLIAYRAVMRETIAHHDGRVVDSPGDNLLAEFAGVEAAVESAVEIQQSLRARNAELSEGRRLEFRIGVNVGDVMAEGDRIYGDAVNIAARLEALAEAGGICVSKEVYDPVALTLPLKWESLGEQSLKNISRRVSVYRARLAPTPWTPISESPFRPAYRPSIAVLRFREFGVGEEHRYFAEGIVEDISGALASLPDLFVISSNSTSRFQSGPLNIASVGHDLAVRYVLSGSVRRSGNRIRILSELADTETQMVLWTDRIEGQVDDLFDLQDRLSEKIVTTIAPHVRAAEMRRALRKRPENLDAYDFMLRGLDLLYRLRRDEFNRAREMFDRSITLDPGYATPHALIALWCSIQVGQGWSENTRETYAEAGRHAEAALERDPSDARALALSGHVRSLLFHDYEGAFALFDRAIAASPNSAVAWTRSSPTYSYVGDAAEATRRAQIGLRLSPFDPHVFFAHSALGFAAYTGGDLNQAIVWGRKAMSQNPNFTANLRFLAASLAAAGRLAEAAEVGKALLVLEPAFHVKRFAETYAYKDPARRVAFGDHLRSAGLPD
jgi:class 3 adenylate cyclase/tetratricopeptide (TPR) repeat protein